MTTDRVLLNGQRKQLHDILLARGVEPASTKWTTDGKTWTHGGAETLEAGLCYFLFKPDPNGTLSIYLRPGLDGGAPVGVVHRTWSDVLDIFSAWAIHVKNEMAEEDPWQQYAAYVPPERFDESTGNSPFTHQEAEHVANSVSSLLEHMKRELPHYSEVAERFDKQFERLAEQAKGGAGRVDWSNQFVGTLISVCIALSLAPEEASSLWRFWVHVIGRLLLTH